MMLADLPPQMQERIVCSVQAAAKYDLDPIIMLAVAATEGGKAGQWVKNSNGTHDVGAMQLNTAYLATLSKFGITAEDVAKPGCYAYHLAAWRIKGHIVRDKGELWAKVANYHSYTPKYNQIYRAKLIANAKKWSAWLSNHNYENTNGSLPQNNTFRDIKNDSTIVWKSSTIYITK